MAGPNPYDKLLKTIDVGGTSYKYYDLQGLGEKYAKLPYSIRVLLESAIRNCDNFHVKEKDVNNILDWEVNEKVKEGVEVAFKPARVILQDFTGVPAVVDFAAMRDAVKALGGDPDKINPICPSDLVIDHSIQVDFARTEDALQKNEELEFERNKERFTFLKWGAKAFRNMLIVPPGSGIVHQVNLEYLARVVFTDSEILYPDSVVGTDSHTTMINGLGVVGWGVGGIEAEAVMLGQAISMLLPEVIGYKVVGKLSQYATSTDLVLTITKHLRQLGVVGKFVEFFGPGVAELSIADRATISNMCPEYGATVGFFPVDVNSLSYLKQTNRDNKKIQAIEHYLRKVAMLRDYKNVSEDPVYSKVVELDLATVVSCISGPKRPHDRVSVTDMKKEFAQCLMRKLLWLELAELEIIRDIFRDSRLHFVVIDRFPGVRTSVLADASRSYHCALQKSILMIGERPKPVDDHKMKPAITENISDDLVGFNGYGLKPERVNDTGKFIHDGVEYSLRHGSVVIAAITSCTNTSNPSVMLGAGLLAKKAVEAGLTVAPYIKTSLSPGSGVVTHYLRESGVVPFLNNLGFSLVGFGCMTCIGNSGPLPEYIVDAIEKNGLVCCGVLSGNRNFEGRVHPNTRANYLASPLLVIAYAIAGRVDIDFETEPLGKTKDGKDVYLREIWPSRSEIQAVEKSTVIPAMFRDVYSRIENGSNSWRLLTAPEGKLYPWDPASTYIKNPPFFQGMTKELPKHKPITNARALVVLGDSVTTDHISPAGSIARNSPAARYLANRGLTPKEFNSYGSRRGNDDVMARGTFANIRLVNKFMSAPGPKTVHIPSGEEMDIFDAAERYHAEGTTLIAIVGKDYGSGSSRDWAAKGPFLLGIKAVIAESYERIHRANLVGMGIVPLEFLPGQNADSLGLTGKELYSFDIPENLKPLQRVQVKATNGSGGDKTFEVVARFDTEVDLLYYYNGGILNYMIRKML